MTINGTGVIYQSHFLLLYTIMEKNLLEIVIEAYTKMTGLKNVTADTIVIQRHIIPLRKRLSVTGGFMILKDAKLDTIQDFVIAIDSGMYVYSNYAERVLQIAKALSGAEYTSNEELFNNCTLTERYNKRCALCDKISTRYQVQFDDSIDSLRSAEDFAKYIFKRVNVDKTLK